MSCGDRSYPAGKASSPAHQVRVVQVANAPKYLLPPSAKAATGLQQGDVAVQHNPVDAVVAAPNMFGVALAEGVGQWHHGPPGKRSRSVSFFTGRCIHCRAAATASGRSPRRRVGSYRSASGRRAKPATVPAILLVVAT